MKNAQSKRTSSRPAVPQRKRAGMPNPAGRPKSYSGLAARIEGVPFSILGALRRAIGPLSMQDCADLIGCSLSMAHKMYDEGKLPPSDLGLDVKRVDPMAWALMIERKNPHFKASASAYLAAA